jgi:hypothetical protein
VEVNLEDISAVNSEWIIFEGFSEKMSSRAFLFKELLAICFAKTFLATLA